MNRRPFNKLRANGLRISARIIERPWGRCKVRLRALRVTLPARDAKGDALKAPSSINSVFWEETGARERELVPEEGLEPTHLKDSGF